MQGGATATIGSRFGLPTGSPHWSGWVALGAIDLARRGMAAGDHGLPTVLAGLPLRARKGG
jgi:hypothetical protein